MMLVFNELTILSTGRTSYPQWFSSGTSGYRKPSGIG